MNEFRLIPLNRCYCGDTEAWEIGWFSCESISEIETEIRSHLSCLWTSATRLVREAFHFQIALQALNPCSILTGWRTGGSLSHKSQNDQLLGASAWAAVQFFSPSQKLKHLRYTVFHWCYTNPWCSAAFQPSHNGHFICSPYTKTAVVKVNTIFLLDLVWNILKREQIFLQPSLFRKVDSTTQGYWCHCSVSHTKTSIKQQKLESSCRRE